MFSVMNIHHKPETSEGHYEEPMEQEIETYDLRFTRFLGSAALLFVGLITAAICWGAATLVGLKSDVAVLLARPEGISHEEFYRNAQRWDKDIEDLKRGQRNNQ